MNSCLICKLHIEQGKAITGPTCEHRYHHLKMYLTIGRYCVNCRIDFPEEIINKFDEHEIIISNESLHDQLERIFPNNPPEYLESYFQKIRPNGFSPEEYVRVFQRYVIKIEDGPKNDDLAIPLDQSDPQVHSKDRY